MAGALARGRPWAAQSGTGWTAETAPASSRGAFARDRRSSYTATPSEGAAVERQQRRLAAILAADVVGYSRLMAADEAGTLARFNALKAEILEPKIGQFEGRIVGSAGDSLLVEFGSAVDAVQCAVEAQERIASRNADVPEDRRIVVRMGINLGDVIAGGDTIHGDGVNVASRLERLAEPGTVLVARSIHDQVAGKLPYGFADLGERSVKNIPVPIRAFRVDRGASAAPAPAVRADDLPLPEKPSVAVLPLANMSGDPEQEYFSDGITEDIITELSRNRDLFVIARNSSFAFKGPAADISEVGRKLGVRYVVEGSVRTSGKRVRITAQLVEAATGSHVWAERYDRDLDDVFAVQDDVVERIAWSLTGHVTRAEIDRSKRSRTENLDAYGNLLRGIEAFHRYTREDIAKAIRHFETAVDIDPTSPRGHAWLARALGFAAGFDQDSEKDRRSLAAATRSLALGESGGHAEATVAAYCWWDGKHELAEPYLERAIAQGPNDPYILAALGFIRLFQGRAAEAREVGERLRRLDPLNPRWVHELLAFAYYLLGDYAASLDAFRRWGTVETQRSLANLAACLAQLGRIDEAKAALQRAIEAQPGFTVEGYLRGSPYRRQQDLDRWLDGLRKAGVAI
jgi:TolB-like protein